MKEEWKDKLQCSMADFEEAVPEVLWQDIEERLSANDVVIGKAERRKPMRRTMVVGILAAAACAACVVGFFLDREKVEVGSGDFTAKTQNAKSEYIEQGGEKHLAQNTANTSGVSPKATVAVVASQKSSEKHGGVMVRSGRIRVLLMTARFQIIMRLSRQSSLYSWIICPQKSERFMTSRYPVYSPCFKRPVNMSRSS